MTSLREFAVGLVRPPENAVTVVMPRIVGDDLEDTDEITVDVEVRPVSGRQHRRYESDLSANVIAKADAGSRLFFALHHNPQLMSGDLFRAYLAAQRVFMPEP